jgi:hypothetical protein
MARSTEREIDQLYALPPEEFTQARDRLAKDLKAAGDQAGAARVRALRRPTVGAWAVNRVVRQETKAADALLKAGDELRKAQRRILSGVSGGGPLREAADSRRKAVRALLKAAEAILDEAGRSTAATLEAVQATLDTASTDEQAAKLFREGRLGKEFPPPAGFGSVEGLALVPSPEPKAPPKVGSAGKEKSRTGRNAARVKELRAERDEARRAARSLEQAAASARKEATRAAQAAVKAEEDAERARRSAEEARRRARDLAAAAREAGSEVSRAEREADRARRALEQAEQRLSAGGA